MSGVQDLVTVYRALAQRCDYALHLGLTEAGMGTKGTVASTAALALLLQEGIGDTIRVSLTPQPGEARTQEVVIALEILQSLGLRAFNPSVTACPGCGRTTSTTFQELAKQIDDFLRAQMPVWRGKYPGVENLKVAVMGCIVNGPGESKHADIGISLPGTGESPAAPVFIDGEKALTLRGDNIVGEFHDLVSAYIDKRFGDPHGRPEQAQACRNRLTPIASIGRLQQQARLVSSTQTLLIDHMAEPLKAVKGMSDILPPESARWEWLEQQIRSLMARYGYANMRTPIVEPTALFVRGLGEVTDIVEKEMYSFEDSMNGDRLTLRPESTAGVVRAMNEHNLLREGGRRLYYIGPMFRHERPQKGRSRQFHQFGAEALGYAGPDVDAELILMLRALWRRLGLREGDDVRLELNSLGQPAERQAHRAALVAYFEAHADQLDDDSQRRLHSNPLRILDSKNPAMQALIDAAPKLPDFLGAESLAHFDAVARGARCGRPAVPAESAAGARPRLLQPDRIRMGHRSARRAGHGLRRRPLRRPDRATRRQAGAGGRFRPRAGALAAAARRTRSLLPVAPAPMVYAVVPGPAGLPQVLTTLEALREVGVSVLMNAGFAGMKSQFKRADASGARFALIFGDDELARGEVALKNLRDAAVAQRSLPLAAVAVWAANSSTHNLAFAERSLAMATQLDLEEQEQLDQLKAFWKQYGNLITWALIAVLGSFAAWNGWNWWQREQAVSAGGMYDELEKAVEAGDAATVGKIFDDLKSRYPRTAFAQQGGLLAAKLQYDKGQAEAAQATLRWVAAEAVEDEYKTLAHLRLAGLLFDAKQYDAALKQLDAAECARASRRWSPIAAAISCWRRTRPTRPRPPTSRPGRRWTASWPIGASSKPS